MNKQIRRETNKKKYTDHLEFAFYRLHNTQKALCFWTKHTDKEHIILLKEELEILRERIGRLQRKTI